MEEDKKVDVEDLELISIIGFDGNPRNGLKVHPDGIHIVYPLGNKLAIKNWQTKKEKFLEGHTNVISAVAISNNGLYVASGQINHMGFKASVILWDFQNQSILLKYESHKVRVEAVVFSCCDTYLISLGGPDDSNIIVWDINAKEALCGSYASDRTSGDALTLSPMNLRGPCFMTGGECTLKVWTLNTVDRNLHSMNVSLGKIKRIITCIQIDYKDEFAFCGTSTGDIVKVKLNYSHNLNTLDPVVKPVLIGCYAKVPRKFNPKQPYEAERYSLGVGAILLLDDDSIIVGAGDGTVDMVRERDMNPDKLIQKGHGKLINPSLPMLIVIKTASVVSTITSTQKLKDELLVGTIQCELYVINMKTFTVKLMVTCHTSTIYDVAFPSVYSDVFATASKDDVRVWSVQTSQELLRISVPNFTCSGVIFTHDGKAIITSWNDGTIRAFTPQSGRLIFTILSAHNKGVSAIAITTDNKKIVSGGGEGQVRVWDVKPSVQSLLFVLKEHKGPVSSIDVSCTNKEAVTASTDGTCIIWDIECGSRMAILFSSTLFMCVRYHPSSCQVITCGTNRMIAYWEIYDGSLIREVEGSKSSALNTLDITANGKYFATGGSDQVVKLWKYKEGITTHVGVGHAGVITGVRFSPNLRTIVSTSADGAIFIWRCPTMEQPTPPRSAESISSRSTCSLREAKLKNVENISQISPTQRVRAQSAQEQEPGMCPAGGSVKCYCSGKCKCKTDFNQKPGSKESQQNGSGDSKASTPK